MHTDFKRRSSSGSSTVQSNGTIHKFNPLLSRIDEDGNAVDVINRYQCVTLMKEYENKSLEELRYEDYRQANRRHTMDTTTENRLKYSVNLIGNLYASRLSTETNKPGKKVLNISQFGHLIKFMPQIVNFTQL